MYSWTGTRRVEPLTTTRSELDIYFQISTQTRAEPEPDDLYPDWTETGNFSDLYPNWNRIFFMSTSGPIRTSINILLYF